MTLRTGPSSRYIPREISTVLADGDGGGGDSSGGAAAASSTTVRPLEIASGVQAGPLYENCIVCICTYIRTYGLCTYVHVRAILCSNAHQDSSLYRSRDSLQERKRETRL